VYNVDMRHDTHKKYRLKIATWKGNNISPDMGGRALAFRVAI